MPKHKDDFYADTKIHASDKPARPAISAATVILLRDHQGELEVLMLQKTAQITFGGMWVFPGGRIDPGDQDESGNENATARNAAVRETSEEAGIDINKENFIWFSHWMPPPHEGKRFSTWFFVTSSDKDHEICIDDGEIKAYQWINPAAALQQHIERKINLVPPTWVSLYQLSKYSSVNEAITKSKQNEPKFYRTQLVENSDGDRVTLWEGDAGYETRNADAEGETHRLIMAKDGFKFLHSAVKY